MVIIIINTVSASVSVCVCVCVCVSNYFQCYWFSSTSVRGASEYRAFERFERRTEFIGTHIAQFQIVSQFTNVIVIGNLNTHTHSLIELLMYYILTTHTYIHTHTHTQHTHTQHTHPQTHTHTQTHARTHTHTHAHTHNTHTHTHTHTHYTHIYKQIHTCMLFSFFLDSAISLSSLTYFRLNVSTFGAFCASFSS